MQIIYILYIIHSCPISGTKTSAGSIKRSESATMFHFISEASKDGTELHTRGTWAWTYCPIKFVYAPTGLLVCISSDVINKDDLICVLWDLSLSLTRPLWISFAFHFILCTVNLLPLSQCSASFFYLGFFSLPSLCQSPLCSCCVFFSVCHPSALSVFFLLFSGSVCSFHLLLVTLWLAHAQLYSHIPSVCVSKNTKIDLKCTSVYLSKHAEVIFKHVWYKIMFL